MSKKTLNLIVFLLLSLVFSVSVAAQNITVTGTVVDPAEDEPLIGASVMQKGAQGGVVTDADGNFTIKVPSNAVLVVSYVGYKTQEVPVNGRTTINI